MRIASVFFMSAYLDLLRNEKRYLFFALGSTELCGWFVVPMGVERGAKGRRMGINWGIMGCIGDRKGAGRGLVGCGKCGCGVGGCLCSFKTLRNLGSESLLLCVRMVIFASQL